MNKHDFIASCYQQLLAIFEKTKSRQKDDKQKHRTEGYIQAGKVMGLITNDEVQVVMDKAHFEVFTETIESRKSRKASLKEAIERGDDSYIDIPAYERNK